MRLFLDSPRRLEKLTLTQATMRWLLACSFLLCLSFHSQVVLAKPELVYSIRTDKTHYILGESVTVTFSWQNVTSQAFRIESYLMEPIEVFFENQETPVRFKGAIFDGIPGYRLLPSRQKIEESYIINHFSDPNYAVDKPGRYILKSTYASSYYMKSSNFWIGTVSAPAISFEVRVLAEEELSRYRARVLSGDFQAIQIVAAHRDEAAIPLLVTLSKSAEITIRQMAYSALGRIGSDESIRSLAEAMVGEPLPMEKVKILMLGELNNPVAIPYLKTLLKDEYVGGYTTTLGDGSRTVRYKVYMVRKWAYIALKKLGVDISTVYEEEIK